jgi:ABC-type transporter Mla subunit MlaD
MADVSITLGVIGNALTSGLNKARKEVDGFAGGAASSLSRLTKSLGVLGGGFTLGAIVKQGFEFNQTMQDGEVAISNVLKTFKGLNDEAAKGEAAKAMELLAEAEPRAAGSLQDLAQGFIATAAAAAGAGLSVEENIDLVARFANALDNSGMSLDQLNQELKSVITANVGSDSFIGKLLEGKGLDNKRIAQLTQEGRLYGEIVKELGAMGESGDTASVALSSLGSALDKAAGALTKGLFGEAISGAKDFSQVLDDTRPFLEDIGKGLAAAAKIGRATFEGLTDAAAVLMFTLDKSQGGSALDRARKAIQELDELYKQRSKMRQKAEAEENKSPSSGGAGPAASKSAVESTLEKQKKQTYDIGKNIQDQAKAVESVLDPYRQFLDYLDEAKRKQEALNESAKAAKQIAQTKVESQKNFAQSLEDEVKILEAKATGDEDAIKKAEREVEIKNRAQEIQQQLGKNAKEALDIAERMQALQDAANEAAEGKGKKEGRIQGYSQERQGGRDEARARADQRMNEARERIGKSRERGFGGIGEFYENQKNPNFAKPQTPMLDGSKLRPVQSSVDSNASVTVLNEMKALAERSTKALEAISVV